MSVPAASSAASAPGRLLRHPAAASGFASAGLGLALAAVAFGAQGGSEIGRTAAVEIALLLAGGLATAAAIAYSPAERPAYGSGTVWLFLLFAVLAAVSIGWSIAPELTWFEAGKTLAYVVVLAGSVGVARLAPGGWPVILKGILIAAALVVAYALASRVWPGTLAENELYARIGKPFNYWNAVGVTAALAIPPALWLGARRSGHPPLNALAFPLLGLLIAALFLSYSRSALAAGVIGAGLWFVFVPLRLRSLTVLVVSATGAGPVIAWALNKDAFTQDGVPLAVRESASGTFGLLLAAMLAVLLAAGLFVGFRAARRAPSARVRRRAGIAAIAVGASLPLVVFAGVAFSDRGIGGTLSDLTDESASVSGGPDRLTQSSSSRAKYWGEAFDVFGENTFKGTGANTFGIARLQHRDDVLVARHAHGFLAQTASDLGLIGLFAAFALAGAWLAAAARTVGARRGGRSAPFDAERVGVIAIALAALVFGLQSLIDWTWSVPGPSVMAIVAAGFVAGRGPLPALAGAAHAPRPAGLPLAAETAVVKPTWGRPSTERLVAAGLVLAAVAVTAWAAWQPARANDASNEALALLDQGRLAEAAREADRAYDLNPLTPKPLFVKAQVLQRAGNLQGALGTLEQAVVEHPAEPDVWLRLATFQLRVLDNPQAALDTLRGALYLDPRSRLAQTTFFDARIRFREQQEAAQTG